MHCKHCKTGQPGGYYGRLQCCHEPRTPKWANRPSVHELTAEGQCAMLHSFAPAPHHTAHPILKMPVVGSRLTRPYRTVAPVL